MAFDSLTEKLQNVFKNLRSKGRLTEDDVKEALKEIKRALLAADVNFKVVKDFIKSVQERAIGQDVMNGLNPGQMVIKIVNEELINLMGSETTEIQLQPGKAITVIMMAGLQGAGKTTTTAKLAGKFKLKGKKPLLVACDVYRPAAIKQLQVNGEKQGVEVFSMGENHKPANIARAAIEHAQKNGNDLVILDTAGRLHIDEDMMAELEEIKEEVDYFVSLDRNGNVIDNAKRIRGDDGEKREETFFFEQRGKLIDKSVIEEVYRMFDGYTWFVQMIMNELFALTEEGERCSMDKIEIARKNVILTQESSYKDLLANLAPKQKLVLQAIAKEGRAEGLTSSAFIKKYKLPSASSVQSAVKPLLKNDLITQEDGFYRVYDYFFADWMARIY